MPTMNKDAEDNAMRDDLPSPSTGGGRQRYPTATKRSMVPWFSPMQLLRTAPEVRFVFDPSIEYGIRLEELLQSEKERSPAPEDIEAEREPDGE